MSWKTVLLCFRTWGMGGQNIQEVRELEDRLPEAGTPEGPLAPINSLPTMEAYRPLLSQDVLQARFTNQFEGQHPGHQLNTRLTRRPMIVGMRAARALGERRLPKFLFPTLPHRQEDPRKEEMTEQTVKKMKPYQSWTRSWALWKIQQTIWWPVHKH